MKSTILFIILTCFVLTARSQNIFFETILENYISDDMPSSVINDDNGNYIFSAITNDLNSNLRYTCLFKLSEKGDTIASKKINVPEKSSCNTLLKTIDGNFIALGAINDSINNASLWVLKLDTAFNILSEKIYSTDYEKIYKVFSKIDKDRNIIVSGFAEKHNDTSHSFWNIYFYKLTQDGDTIKSKFFKDTNTKHRMAEDILEKKDSSGYLIFARGYNDLTNTWSQVINLDTNLNVIAIEGITGYFGYFEFNNSAKWLTDTSYLLTGTRNYGDEQDIEILLMDKNNNAISYNYFGEHGTPDYPAWIKSLDFVKPDSIYFVGFSDVYENLGLPSYYNYIIINNLDSNLNLNWQKYYGGDAYYEVESILATSDGGCLVLSWRYDYETQNNERDIHILKIGGGTADTATVDTTSITGDVHCKFKDIILYPNPGYNQVYVRTALKGDIFLKMYDITGNLIINKKIKTGITQISVSTLPEGIYFYRFTNNKKIIETGKWIKQ